MEVMQKESQGTRHSHGIKEIQRQHYNLPLSSVAIQAGYWNKNIELFSPEGQWEEIYYLSQEVELEHSVHPAQQGRAIACMLALPVNGWSPFYTKESEGGYPDVNIKIFYEQEVKNWTSDTHNFVVKVLLFCLKNNRNINVKNAAEDMARTIPENVFNERLTNIAGVRRILLEKQWQHVKLSLLLFKHTKADNKLLTQLMNELDLFEVVHNRCSDQNKNIFYLILDSEAKDVWKKRADTIVRSQIKEEMATAWKKIKFVDLKIIKYYTALGSLSMFVGTYATSELAYSQYSFLARIGKKLGKVSPLSDGELYVAIKRSGTRKDSNFTEVLERLVYDEHGDLRTSSPPTQGQLNHLSEIYTKGGFHVARTRRLAKALENILNTDEVKTSQKVEENKINTRLFEARRRALKL